MAKLIDFKTKSNKNQIFANLKDFADAAHRWLDAEYQPVAWHTYSEPDGTQKTKPFKWKAKILSITHEDVPKYFDTGCVKISIRSGIKNGGLVNVDLDSHEAVRLAPDFLPDSNCVFGRASNPASHWLYKVTDAPNLSSQNFKDADSDMLVEIIGDNKISTVPPSIWMKEESHEIYQFEPGKAGLPTEVTGKALTRAVAHLAVATVMTKMWPKKKGIRHETALALAGGLCAAGLPEHEARQIVGAVAKAAGDEEVGDRVKAVETTYALHHGGENHTGWPTLAELLGVDGPEVANTCREWLGASDDPNTNNTKRLPPNELLLSVLQLAALDIPEREDIVAPWIKIGSLTLMFSAPKVGKTWFALGLGNAVGSGENFLGWNVPKPRRVLYVDGEMALSELQGRVREIIHGSKGNVFTLASQVFYDAGERPLNLDDEVDQKWLDGAIEACNAEVIILDTLSSLTTGRDENDNSDPGLEGFLAWLVALRHRGKAVIVVHHSGHADRHPRGASRIEGVVDTVVKLSKEDGEGVFTISFPRLRGKVPKPAVLTVRLTSYDLIGGAKIKLLEPTGKPDKTATILLAIASGKAKTQAKLAKMLGVSTGKMSDLLKELRAKGLVADKKLALTPEGQKLADEAAQGGEFQPAA